MSTKRRTRTGIAYTREEGGIWLPHGCDRSAAEIAGALFDNAYHVRKDGRDYYRSILPAGRTVHSVRFPDGRIWDAQLGTFRYLFTGSVGHVERYALFIN